LEELGEKNLATRMEHDFKFYGNLDTEMKGKVRRPAEGKKTSLRGK